MEMTKDIDLYLNIMSACVDCRRIVEDLCAAEAYARPFRCDSCKAKEKEKTNAPTDR
jgi:hypothetical protein